MSFYFDKELNPIVRNFAEPFDFGKLFANWALNR